MTDQVTPKPAGWLLTLGEILLRLSPPGRELLLQTPNLEVWVGGAEANVATQLAVLGHRVRLASRVPDNELGRAAIRELRGRGVDVANVALGGERMGLYFVTPGAGRRATHVFYDRAASAFADAEIGTWDWDTLFEGVDHLHLSGVTPALGPRSAELALRCAELAKERGVRVSFDGNWRGKLWARWQGDPRAILSGILKHVDVMFGDRRDIALVLGYEDLSNDERTAAERMFAAFPRLGLIASTTRQVVSADHNRLGARIDTRDGVAVAPATDLGGIVDRIGSGDAFVAGVLDALHRDCDIEAIAKNGLALAVLKHSLPGDAATFDRSEIEDYEAGGGDVRR